MFAVGVTFATKDGQVALGIVGRVVVEMAGGWVRR